MSLVSLWGQNTIIIMPIRRVLQPNTWDYT